MTQQAQVPAPLYRDPIFDGAADPMVIYNRHERAWWMLYTQRRANVDARGVAYCYGCTVGIAESRDGGNSWSYVGGLDLEFERGTNTFWAPEVIEHDGIYHMYVSYTRGVHHRFCGNAKILHYTSKDLWTWEMRGEVEIAAASVIDACVFRLPSGVFRMWYKNERSGSHTWAMDSDDLYCWRDAGPVITDCAHEGPNVFAFDGYFWMIVDCWNGQGVYRSDDLISWHRQADNILLLPGRRLEDGTIGGHADVAVSGGRAYIFYFTHPERTRDYYSDSNYETVPYGLRRSSIQAAELFVEKGVLACDRNRPFSMKLQDG